MPTAGNVHTGRSNLFIIPMHQQGSAYNVTTLYGKHSRLRKFHNEVTNTSPTYMHYDY